MCLDDPHYLAFLVSLPEADPEYDHVPAGDDDDLTARIEAVYLAAGYSSDSLR